MPIQVKSSVLAVTVETTENTPVAPTGAGQFIPLQPDFAMNASFEQLENLEMKASIGMSKTITGSENPTASGTFYLKHSGTEGVATHLDEVLTAGFGAEVIASTEYDTVSSSTVTLIKVDTGEGAQFQRGQLLLVKDATNGYSIRPVQSVSGDDLTLGFPLQNAPSSGVNLGKCVLYKPANTGHQTLTLWHYAGNGGATQMISGARVSEMGIEFNAGQLNTLNVSFEGLEFYFNPIEITASTKYLDFTADAVTSAAIVATGFYKDPHKLADAIALAMNDVSADDFTVTYSNTTGKFTIASTTASTLSLLWNTGVNVANTIASKIGFSTAANDTGSLSYLGDNAISFAAAYTPTYDSTDPLVAKSNLLLIGSGTETTCFQANSVGVTISTPRAVTDSICSDSGRSGSVINGREVTITVAATLNQYDADKFQRLRANTDTRLFYAFGEKSGGNWVAGKSGGLYIPTCSVISHSLVDNEGLYDLEIELKAFVDNNGNGEVYLGFV